MALRLRRHQEEVERLCRAIAAGATGVTDVLAAVTPGGGKSSLPVIAAARLLGAVPPGRGAPVAERVCWVVPRETLRRQAEEAFVDPAWRSFLGHAHAVRAADNGPDPCRGLSGYVTTYQSLAAAPGLHLAEFQRRRYLLCVDELHHLPGLGELDAGSDDSEDTAWSKALLPLLETAAVRLLMTGTLERADRRPILWLGYKRDPFSRHQRRVDLKTPGWAVVGYDRRAALAERAIIPIRFGALDGEAEWFLEGERCAAPSFKDAGDRLRPMLFTALRTGYADTALRRAFDDCREHRAARRAALGLGPGETARGLGKLLVVAPDQATARRYQALIEGWLGGPAGVALAISDERDAAERIARFRLRPHPSVLVTVGMAYEGLDAPEISHVACLTHVRSVPWLEQMVARATRFDPHGGPHGQQRAVVYHPDDPLFRRFRRAVESEQSGRAWARRRGGEQAELDLGDDPGGAAGAHRLPVLTPLRSGATELVFETVHPRRPQGPEDLPASWATDPAATVPETPAQAEHRLRRQVGQMVAAQVVEDGDAGHPESGHHAYHGYNAALKRLFGKPRAAMTLAELEALVGWLERNRVREHLAVLADDHRYAWVAQARRRTPGARRARVTKRSALAFRG